jgi:target of EGR1 protein 1
VEKKSSSRRDYGRELVAEICKLATPIVLHNGLIDLIFLYENFYAKCPDSFMKFVADLSDMFKGGVFDTKYIADYHAGSKASFLEYLYKYAYVYIFQVLAFYQKLISVLLLFSVFLYYLRLYENTQNKKAVGNKRFVDLIAYGETSGFFTLADFNLDLYETVALAREELEERLCKNYSVYGYCDRVASKKCVKVHCVDEILKIELTKKLKNNKKLKLESEVVSKQPSESNSVSSVNITPVENKTHSAGLDAFMTGYVMLNYLNKFGKFQLKFDYDLTQRQLSDFVDLNEFMGSGEFQNNVYLTGKDYPLMVKKSNFTSLSQNHVEKKARLALKNETE